jgi:hypothetical protein
VNGGPEFDDLVADDVPEGERARLARVHALLVAAGPPPELSPALEQAPGHDDRSADVVPFLPRRRRGLSLAAAATVGVLAFVGGSLWGQQQNSFSSVRSVEMHGVGGVKARAAIEIADEDAGGNWPMRVRVRGLQPLPKTQYYELWLTRKGEPIASCGTFNTRPGDKTEIRLNVAYRLKRFDGWAVTRVQNPRGDHTRDVVMTT